MHHIVHDTDTDGWCSAALLAHEFGPDQCVLHPTPLKDVRPLLLSLCTDPADHVWVLDVPAPPSWNGLESLGGRITWVDHHMDSWRSSAPSWVNVVLPPGRDRTTTMRLLGDRGFVPLQDVRSLGNTVFGDGSRWGAAFAGMSKTWPEPADLAALLVPAVSGGELPDALMRYAVVGDTDQALVDSTLASATTQIEAGLAIVHLDDAHGIPLRQYSLAAAERHPNGLVVLVHRRSRLYCGFRTNGLEAFDLLAHFRSRDLAPMGHAYVCHVAVAAARIDDEVAALRVKVQQRRRLVAIIAWAKQIREHLQEILAQNGHRVHFRPASTGFAMISLLAESPQLGKGSLQSPERLATQFETEFEKWCGSRVPGRNTEEKRLQSFLIRDAQTHGGGMAVLNDASRDGTELYFVTDEVALPAGSGQIVCDLLAVRETGDGWVPVIIELKTARTMQRLVEQLSGFAALVDSHSDLFAHLASVRLGREIGFVSGCEKWMVWPQPEHGGPEPREAELAADGIRVVGYHIEGDTSFGFSVGRVVDRVG